MKSAMDPAPHGFLGKHAVNHSGDLRTVCGAGCHGGVEANLLLLPRGIERGEVIGIVGRGDLERFAARSGQIDTVEFAYVDGSEGVRTETFASEDIDGVKVRATLDFAAKVIDWRGLQKANGAA